LELLKASIKLRPGFVPVLPRDLKAPSFALATRPLGRAARPEAEASESPPFPEVCWTIVVCIGTIYRDTRQDSTYCASFLLFAFIREGINIIDPSCFAWKAGFHGLEPRTESSSF
jgi:hypothetical protein